MINKAIFKSYDVRGIYPSELNEAVARHIGMAFSTYSGAKKVVVGYDARNSSPELFKPLQRVFWLQVFKLPPLVKCLQNASILPLGITILTRES